MDMRINNLFKVPLPLYIDVNVKVYCDTCHGALLFTPVRLVTRSALQSWTWQL